MCISFSAPLLTVILKIEMKFEAFESQKSIDLEVVIGENVIFDHIVGNLVSRLI